MRPLYVTIYQAANGTSWNMPGLTSSIARNHTGYGSVGYAGASTLGDGSFDGGGGR